MQKITSGLYFEQKNNQLLYISQVDIDTRAVFPIIDRTQLLNIDKTKGEFPASLYGDLVILRDAEPAMREHYIEHIRLCGEIYKMPL